MILSSKRRATNNGLVLAGSVTAPKVNALDGTALERFASSVNLRVVRERSMQILEILVVLLQLVVRVEVREVGEVLRAATLDLSGGWKRRSAFIFMEKPVEYTHQCRIRIRPQQQARRQSPQR